MKRMILGCLCLCILCGCALAQEQSVTVEPTETATLLEDGLSAVTLTGEDHFADFLALGGASSDMEVVRFLTSRLLSADSLTMQTGGFGCSALSVASVDGMLFGRNFDWYHCDAIILTAKPENAYASISTVNMGFLGSASGMLSALPENARTLAAYYAPLDGMNEKGLCAAVLMIQDRSTIDQQTDKPDVTTTTAIRLLLNHAATVDEAVALLDGYDLHASMGYMVHFAIADAAGKSVVVEYVDNEMIVTETPVVTNFYIAEGEKQGIGTQQSHTRFDTLTQALAETLVMNMDDVRDAMGNVSKHNFNYGETTEWTMVCNQQTGEVRYYHRENYETAYVFTLK